MQFAIFILLIAAAAAVVADAVADAADLWIGTSPFCDGRKRDCALYDLDYVRNDKYGDGKYCITGSKVLCRTKPLAKPLIETQSNKLAVVTYNIFERPFFITHDGQTERTCHISRALLSELPQTDVIIFEEAFLGGCLYNNNALSMQAQLKNYGFPYTTEIVGSADVQQQNKHKNSQGYFIINGGVFIASRWPITKANGFVYSDAGHADILSNKGAIYARVNKKGRNYHILGTHMQAQIGSNYDAIRVKQAVELNNFIKNNDIPASEPVLIGGDLNCDLVNNPKNVNDMLTAMNAVRPKIIGDVDSTLDPSTNDVVEDGNYLKEWLDYVVYSKNHLLPTSSSLRALRLTSDEPTTYCNSAKMQPFYVSPWSTLCFKIKTTLHMSDHYPVVAEYEFK